MLVIAVGLAGASETLEPWEVDAIVEAIWVVEGGAGTRFPYGVKSVPVRDAAEAREVCARTVRRNYVRWGEAGRPGRFLDFLGDRYCPGAADPVGNVNWKRNMGRLVGWVRV